MEIVYLDGQKVNIVEPICSAIGFFDGLHIGLTSSLSAKWK